MVARLLERLSETMRRTGLTDMPPAPVRSALPHYRFTVTDWGIADLDHDGTDANDLNHKLSFFIFQFHYSKAVQIDTHDMIHRRIESLARHLHNIGIKRREPLDFFAGIVTQELKLKEPVTIPEAALEALEQ